MENKKNYTVTVEDGFSVNHYYFCDTEKRVINWAKRTFAEDGNEVTVLREEDQNVVFYSELKL